MEAARGDLGWTPCVRRWVHLACTLAVAAVLAFPILLGPAAGWAAHALGGPLTHRCACGMAPGTCGCPECAALDHARAEARAPSTVPVIRSSCGDDDPAVGGGLPAGALPPNAVALPRPLARAVALSRRSELEPRSREKPPTPPPRSLSA